MKEKYYFIYIDIAGVYMLACHFRGKQAEAPTPFQ